MYVKYLIFTRQIYLFIVFKRTERKLKTYFVIYYKDNTIKKNKVFEINFNGRLLIDLKL